MPNNSPALQTANSQRLRPAAQQELRTLLEKIHGARGVDFQEYRESTIHRRLLRRLRVRAVQTFAEYGEVLDRDPGEYERLFDDLTINVTAFFRDELAFRALAEIALPMLLECKREKKRIWSAGCATGAEPYSIAMLLEEMGAGAEVELLATDLDSKALARARKGSFTAKEVVAVPPLWRDKYFTPIDSGFAVRPCLRKRVSFVQHNLASDLFYQQRDLVVCRNVLIYFAVGLQQRVLQQVWDGLNEGGLLLLGRAELPTQETKRLFESVDRYARLFSKTSSPGNGVSR